MTFSFKFFPFKDFIFSILPTVASFEGYIQEVLPMGILSNRFVEIGLGLFISICLALIFHKGNVRTYKKSLAEILATGYISNFAVRLSRLLKGKTEIEFAFPGEKTINILPKNVKVVVGLPKSLNSLRSFAEKTETDTEIVYIREASFTEPYWVRARLEEDQTLTIFKFPRTLFTLPKYLKKDFSDMASSEKKSKKIFEYFNDHVDKLRVEFAQDIPVKQFEFKLM